MDEYYDPEKEYYKRLERLAEGYSGDWAGVDEANDREWIRDYKERQSWNNMEGS